jgi:hypothetical protein
MPPEEAAAADTSARTPAAPGPAPAPQETESFAASMERLAAAGEGIASDDDPVEGGDDGEGEGGEDGGGGEKAAPGAKATQKATAKAATGRADGDAEPQPEGGDAPAPGKPSKAFLEEAEKLGLVIDKRGQVAPRERAQFREYKEKQRQAIDAAAKEQVEQINAVKTELRGELDLAKSVRTAFKNRDPEALAKALGAESYEKMQEEFVKAFADPNYQELLELKRKDEARDRAELERQHREAEAKHRREERQAEERYTEIVTEQMRNSENNAVRAFAQIPILRDAIVEIQKEHWNGKSTVSPERAIRLGRGGAPPLLEEMRGLYKALKPVFDDTPAAEADEGDDGTETPPARPKPTPKPAVKEPPKAKPPGTKTSPTPRPSPSAPVDISKMSEREYSQYVHKRLMEAGDED